MSRPRIYRTNAERQAAYRQRKNRAYEDSAAMERQILNAAWELKDVIRQAAIRGDTLACQLDGLHPSDLLLELIRRFENP